MNKERRKQVSEIADRIKTLKTMAAEIKEAIECIRDDEQEYFDNMPESLQGGEKGDAAQEFISACDEVSSALDSVDDIDTDDLTGF